MKKFFKWSFYFLVIVLFLYTVRKIDFNILNHLKSLSLWKVAFLILLQCLSIVIIALQWQSIIQKFHTKVNLLKIVELNIIGTFTESITPAVKSGGEGVKLLLLKQYFSMEYNEGLSVIIAQKVVSAGVFFLYFLISIICLDFKFTLSYQSCFLFLGILLILGITLYYLFPKKYKAKTTQFLKKVKENLDLIRQDNKLFYQLLVNNLIVWLGYPLKLYIVSSAFDVQLSFFQLSGIIFITYGVSMLPTTPGSIGTYEGTMAMLLTLNKVPLDIALGVSMITRFFTFWLVVLGSGIYLLIKQFLNKEPKEITP
ncbi:flippase-like domain-containing protein [Alkalicella caledoniensis]|uniref:Phosphatidylglycerol lysyltransferase n=1 Tax=Alkalicella caledoniensis TaxID=2731377 RepID=A0A7G9WC63_ALKCA|nr:lysylphosphatidylglycerol synthase transmembrane domain-containing protein [Alkalicella caledoniensis]QNO16275.1 flippase-like domain-containing protein [Alkalicella caledoniensis]